MAICTNVKNAEYKNWHDKYSSMSKNHLTMKRLVKYILINNQEALKILPPPKKKKKREHFPFEVCQV